MKHKIFILLLTTCCSTRVTLPMEPASTHNEAAIINTIDAEINRQYPASLVDEVSYYAARGFGNFAITAGYDPSSVSRQIEGNARKTMGIVGAFKSVQWNENIINVLYVRNVHFSRAVDYYIARLLSYYQKITIENLNKAVNCELEHPIADLNTLVSGIKKYIIDNALKKITHEYTMEFSEDGTIENFDICEYDTVHLAATKSSCCNHVSIWNLLTGKLLRRLEKKGDVIEQIRFNPTGSQLATAGASTTDMTKWVKIWNPQSGSLLYTIPQVESSISLSYFYESWHNTLINLKNHDMHWSKQEMWLLDKSDPEYRGSNLITRELPQWQGKTTTSYKVSHPCSGYQLDSKKLYITKTVCPMLYLCERAINKAETKELLQTIEGTLPFVALTDYEKPMIRLAVRNKIEALSEKQLRLHAINKMLDEDLY